MKTFTRYAAQGDFLIIKIDALPQKIEAVTPRGAHHVIAHSETGHDHVMEAERVQCYKPMGTADKDIYELFLAVEAPTEINHLRSFDTHEPILVNPGNYMVKRQREYVAEGFRRAAD